MANTSSSPLVSFIVPTFNRKELLTLGLTSLVNQGFLWDYEIIVLNEGLEDGTRGIVESMPGTKYILTRPSMTQETLNWRVPTLAINYGVRQAKGKYIVLTCPEMYHANSDNVYHLVRELLNNKKAIAYNEGLDDRYGNFLKAVRENRPQSVATVLDPTVGFYELNTKFPFFMGMAKEVFEEVGGYDEDFKDGYCFDDTNFCRRLENSGYEFVKAQGKVIHLYHERLRYGMAEVQALWKINEKLYLDRYQDKVANVGREWGNL